VAGIFLSYLYFSFDGNEAAPSRNGPKSADDPRTCPQLHRLQLRATLASLVRNNFLGTDQPRGPMRGATWTTHPRTRRTDDINQLASETTQQSFQGEGPPGGDYESSPEGGPLGGDYELDSSLVPRAGLEGGPFGGDYELDSSLVPRTGLEGGPLGGDYELNSSLVPRAGLEGGPLGGDYARESSHVGGPLGGDYDDGHQPASWGGSSDDLARLQPGVLALRILCTHPEPLVPSPTMSRGRGLDTGARGFSRGRPYWSLEPSVTCDGEDRQEDGRYEGQRARGLRVLRQPTSRRRSPMAGVRWGEASKPGPGDSGADWDDSAPEEVEVIPTTDVEAPKPLAGGQARLRAPATLYHLFCGGIGGFLGAMASGFSVVGGCDTSEGARQTFAGATRASTTERVEEVVWEGARPDAVLATPPTDGFSVGRSKGAELAAAQAFNAAVKGILESGTTVGVIETVWEVTTAQSGTVYRRMVKQALKGGYTSYFRYASPHRLGGGEVRPRLFIFLVPTAAVERVGPPPLLALSRGGVPTRTVRSCLTNTDSRETVVVGPIRWRRGPRRVGAAVILGHYGRGGKGDADLLDSIWSVDGAAPPTEDLSKVVYACDGQLIRLTPREFARVRGIHDSIDIGEGAGPRHARSCVRRSPSVSAVAAATAAAKDYIHSVRSAARADREDPPQRPETAKLAETKAAPHFSDGSPQWCTLPTCATCNRANSAIARPSASSRTCADAFRTLAGAAYVRMLRREGGSFWEPNDRAGPRERREVGPGDDPMRHPTSLEPGEQEDHARVCQKMNASWHGFRYVYGDLHGRPYRTVKRVPCVMRTLVFWRFPSAGYGAKFRLWARGAPAFRQHAWHEPTRDGNYASGDGETAANFIQSFVADGILIPVSEEKVKAMIASKQSAINPIATIPKATPGQYRFLVDCRRSGTNWMLAKLPSHFPETLSAIHSVVPKDGYSWTSDMLGLFLFLSPG
jgi:hypothetical protein